MIFTFGSGVTLFEPMNQIEEAPRFVSSLDLPESGWGRSMKFAAAILLLFSFVAFPNAQENSATEGVPAAIGLPVGQKAPAFAARDQSGREQSNETLKGSKGTVLLFFRSADW